MACDPGNTQSKCGQNDLNESIEGQQHLNQEQPLFLKTQTVQ